MVFEIALTKIFSVTLWYHFAYFVVSTAMFGLGGGGFISFFFHERLNRNFGATLTWGACVQSISMLGCLVFVLNYDVNIDFTTSGLLDLTLTYSICSFPFVALGMVLSLIFQRFPQETPRLYAVDLVGSALGCIVFFVAISLISGPAVVITAALLALGAALAFSVVETGRPGTTRVVAALAFVAATLLIHTQTDLFRVKFTKTYKERRDVLYEKWSPLARITVYPGVFFYKDTQRPFGWGMSRRFQMREKVEQLWIEQDACAGTPITRFDGNLEPLDFLKWDITSLPYHLKPGAKTFIIGAGGGRDVLTALLFGSSSILACDINPTTINLVKERYRDFAGDLYRMPQVRVEVAEARNFVRSSPETFAIIQISLIDSWAATAAGAFALAENSLYTVEAFRDYLDHLEPDGVLSVTRFLFTPRSQTIRATIVARKALEESGIAEPERHIVVIGTDSSAGVATVLVKKSPFNAEEIDRLIGVINRYGFEPLYLPGYPIDDSFSAAITTRPLTKFIESSYYDIRPTTDDRPFFFQMIYFSRAIDLIIGRPLYGQTENYYAQSVLLALLVIASILVLVFYVLPLLLSRSVERLSAGWGLYFVLLGVGFMMVEIPMLQKGSLYLGHPTYSLTIILFSMLVFAGLGSLWSGRTKEANLKPMLSRCLFGVGVFIFASTLALEWIVPNTIGLPLPLRIVLMVSITGVMAFLMGVGFPSGVRLLGSSGARSIPWVWALNGGASILGSIIAMAISMGLGYRIALMLGGGVYLAAALLIRVMSGNSSPR